MLFGAREGDVRVFEAPDLESLMLTGLDAAAAAELIMAEAGREVARRRCRVADRTHAAAARPGAARVPAALSAEQLAGTERLPDALPLSRAVEEIFLARAGLPDDAPPAAAGRGRRRLGGRAVVARAGEALGVSLDASTRSSGPR